MRIAVKDLQVDHVVWESCQQGNARLTVLSAPERLPNSDREYWQCRVQLDSGQELTVGGDVRLYEEPEYCGVPWCCDPEHIPEWGQAL